ncbi:MAG: hypothetical protein ORN56_06590, partial [Chitinophagales bacterium]|nr:hypothetical protein [Chitinophagales bacterium]
MKRLFIALVIIWLLPRLLFAQLSGTYLIGPSQTYSNLASIISDLNTQGINGSVTISVPANYVETTPAGGFALGSTILNASLNSTSTLQFVKSGVGNNPLIYAAPGKYAGRKLGGLSDVIWALEGCNYVTIDGIDLCDSTSNTTRTTANEVGYGLFKLNAASPFDGCQHNLIQHCTIRLQSKTITGNLDIKSVGIYLFNKTRLGGTVNTLQTGMSLTSASDANSFNRFYCNTIIGPNIGALLVGSYSMYDDGNDFGGYSTATGNAIYSFGNDTMSSAVFVKGGVTDLNISNNIFDNTQASSYSMSNTCSAYLVGIYTEVDFKPTIKSVFGLRIVNNQLTMGMATTTLQFQQTLHCDGMSIDFHDDILIDSNQINFNTANVVNSNG